ncbi:hypothetical protein G9F32_04300 [Acinetobacter sp. 194]|uniref:hypothetical protein n=1 Tax=Acinetobacter shaoyimingii TaxID=2715164 RepID=UPI00140BB1C2|nr:hypothetical protein [Acinetobacter shaoyimingii]NHB57254.1 hypothetical protein [Acinetobacter shaoyimingii]
MNILGIFLTTLGAVLFYFSHPNQYLLKQPLPSFFKILAISSLLMGLVLLLLCMSKVTAVFLWLVLMICIWSFFPFIPLFKRSIQ